MAIGVSCAHEICSLQAKYKSNNGLRKSCDPKSGYGGISVANWHRNIESPLRAVCGRYRDAVTPVRELMPPNDSTRQLSEI